MSSSLDKAVDLRQYWRMIWRRKGLVLLCAVTTISAAMVALVFVPREFESQVTLMIDDSQALSAEVRKVTGGVMDAPTGYKVDEERMAKLMGRIRSRPFLERLIRLLKMNEDPLIRAKAEEMRKRHLGSSVDDMAVRMLVESLQSRIRFRSPGSSLYNVSVADYSAENAQLLAKWISELFVDVSSQGSLDRLRAAHEFGAEQARLYEEQLRRSEEALGSFKKSLIEKTQVRQIVQNENMPLAETVYGRITDEIAAAKDRATASTDSMSRRRLEAAYVDLASEPRVRELTGRLSSALKAEVINGLAVPGGNGGWPPLGNYPALRTWLMQEIESQAAMRHPEVGPEVSSVAARFVFSKIDLDVLKQGAGLLADAIESRKRQAQSTPEDEIELARLETEVKSNQDLLQSFKGQLVASDISQAAEATNLGLKLEILDPANLPLTPSRPNKMKILLASVFLGPLIGVGLAFMSETLDPTLRSLDDFRRMMPEPILGSTPLLSRLPVRSSWMRRHWVPVSVASVVLLAVFLVGARTALLNNLVTSGRPVHMAIPETPPNENR